MTSLYHIRGVSCAAFLMGCVLTVGMPIPGHAAEAMAEFVQVSRADAYRVLRRGDELRERREWSEAVHAFQTALHHYRALAHAAPAWEHDYYRFRIGYCERELAMIVRTTGRTVDEWLADRSGAAEADSERYRDRYYALVEENRSLLNQVDALRQELEVYLEMEDIEQTREEQRARPAPAPVTPRVAPAIPEPVAQPERVPVVEERPAAPRTEPRSASRREPAPVTRDQPVPRR